MSLNSAIKIYHQAKCAVISEMEKAYPVGTAISWKVGNGISHGVVLGHASEFMSTPDELRAENTKTGRWKWVSLYAINQVAKGKGGAA